MFEERIQAEQEQDVNTAREPGADSPGPFSNVNGLETEDTSSVSLSPKVADGHK